MLNRVLRLFMMAVALSFTTGAIAASSPTEDVRTSVDAILLILQNDELDKQQKRAEISKIISASIDLLCTLGHIVCDRTDLIDVRGNLTGDG